MVDHNSMSRPEFVVVQRHLTSTKKFHIFLSTRIAKHCPHKYCVNSAIRPRFIEAQIFPNLRESRVAVDMEGNGEFDFWVIYEDGWRIIGEVWRFFEGFWKKLIRCEKIKNFHQSETNNENEVLRPLWPPQSLRG